MGLSASSPDLTIIAGPTASGKSAHALDVAMRHNGVIINADASQLYAGLPILTAQPTSTDRARIPHELYGVWANNETATAITWAKAATAIIDQVRARGQHPVVVGGTGLYLRALITGFSPVPPVDAGERDTIRRDLAAQGLPALYDDLCRLDPTMAARLRPTDTQRIVRALEVVVSTGRSLADWQALPPTSPLGSLRVHKILIDRPRDTLRARARARLATMINDGVLTEVEALVTAIDQGQVRDDASVTKALGFMALAEVVRGHQTLEWGLDQAFLQTAQYIKRQQTWFRHQMVFDTIITPKE
jgi:tRNA dimethylallyltransferase